MHRETTLPHRPLTKNVRHTRESDYSGVGGEKAGFPPPLSRLRRNRRTVQFVISNEVRDLAVSATYTAGFLRFASK